MTETEKASKNVLSQVVAESLDYATSIIPRDKLSEILRIEANSVQLGPLIADVTNNVPLDLKEEINKLVKAETNKYPTSKYAYALEALQKELIKMSNQPGTGGRKRRRTNKRKNYKKRRSAKHR